LKTTTTTFVVLFALAVSAFARIGESWEQVARDARQDKDTVSIGDWFRIERLPAFEVTYRNGDILRHGFDSNGREIITVWFAKREPTPKEVSSVMNSFRTTWTRVDKASDVYLTYQSPTNLVVMIDVGNHRLFIFDENSRDLALMDKPKSAAPAAPATPVDDLPANCMILATKAWNQLKPPIGRGSPD
jgi:hypothetical protein